MMLYVCGGRYLGIRTIDPGFTIMEGPMEDKAAMALWRELSQRYAADTNVKFELVNDADFGQWTAMHS